MLGSQWFNRRSIVLVLYVMALGLSGIVGSSLRSSTPTNGTFVMTQTLLELVSISVRLSHAVYNADPSVVLRTWFSDNSLSMLDVFTDKPDQALTVRYKDQYCIGVFRALNPTILEDVAQTLPIGPPKAACSNTTNGTVCCNVEKGIYEGYNTAYKADFERALRSCTKNCTRSCPKVVLTGHSQGGAISSVAAIQLADLSPTVVTFAELKTISGPCTLINSDVYYRFYNSRRRGFQPVYDPVPYLINGPKHYGHLFMLGEDSSRMAYLGKDTQTEFRPHDKIFLSHLRLGSVGFIQRIEDFLEANSNSSAMQTNGFQVGSLCTKDVECESKQCLFRRCRRS